MLRNQNCYQYAIYFEKDLDDATSIKIINCADVKIERNRYLPRSKWTGKTSSDKQK